MSDVTHIELWEAAKRLTHAGLQCERVGPTCIAVLRENKVITLGTWKGLWYLETIGALGYICSKDTDVVTFCNECLNSPDFKMSRIPENLVSKFRLKQLSDDEFSAAQINIEIDEEEK